MVLPLNLAMTPSEIEKASDLPPRVAWMSCHFCPFTEGITGIPESLPEGAMLIVDDRQSCAAHSPDLVVQQLMNAAARLRFESILLDFQRPYEAESAAMVKMITESLPCSVAVTERFAKDLNCPVFLPPCPLDITLQEYFRPWHDREIWLEAALCQKRITVTKEGTVHTPIFPTESLSGGLYSEKLLCQYRTKISEDNITFTLFDTPETLTEKLEAARRLGVSRAVGLYQELHTFV